MHGIPLNHNLQQLDELIANDAGLSNADLFQAAAGIGREMGHETADKLLSDNPRLFAYADVLRDGFYQYAVSGEDAEIERIRGLRFTPPTAYSDIMTDRTRRVYNRVRDIFDWLEFERCNSFVMVGCGQLPVSALHVSDQVKIADITCIDIRQDAIDDVNWLATRLGKPELRGQVCDGRNFDYAGAQIVYVANMVRGKDAVVARILETAAPDVQIVVRAPVGLGRLWTEDFNDPAALGLRIARVGHVAMNQACDQLLVPASRNPA